MGAPRQTRVFRSGNSKAVRLPADWPVEVGDELVLREEQGRFVLERAGLSQVEALLQVYGACPDLRPLEPHERELEERELDWDGKLLKGR
jgi:antitoxin VapB